MEVPRFALSIQQPWAWLIVNGHKDIENRCWRTPFRGPVLIHAGKKMDTGATADIADIAPKISFPPRYDLGGIVGVATIRDCVIWSSSPWFFGEFGFSLNDARPLPFMPLRGQLGFFKVADDVRAAIAKAEGREP